MTDPHDPREQMFIQTRPWGQFEQFVSNETVTVKIITVLPGHRLSLQTHNHRGEFWHILDVPLDIEVDDRRWVAGPGEDVWVPQHSIHRIGNSGDRSGRVLEIALGDFDEADISRIDDDYARHAEEDEDTKADVVTEADVVSEGDADQR